jgi:hypothetical protein
MVRSWSLGRTSELRAVDALPAGPVVVREVPALDHELYLPMNMERNADERRKRAPAE